MFYFFQRGSEYLRCEVRHAQDSATEYEIEIVEANGTPRVERYPSSDAVHKRWLELQEQFQKSGWWGPTGRD